jgi:hypothetical protein
VSDEATAPKQPDQRKRDAQGRFVSGTQQGKAKKISEPKQDGAKRDHKESWDIRLSTAVIALATIATVAVTVHHAHIFSEQLAEFREQASSGRIAANAAKQSSDIAAATVPRAWLFVDTGTFMVPKYDTPTEYPEGGVRSYGVKLPINIRNHGKSPALIKEITADLYAKKGWGPDFDRPSHLDGDVADYDRATERFTLRLLTGRVIPADGLLVPDTELSFVFSKLPIVPETFSAKTKWLRITIKYSDPYGSNRQTSFATRVPWTNDPISADSRFNWWQ